MGGEIGSSHRRKPPVRAWQRDRRQQKYRRRRPYFGATNWPWSQSIVALDCMGSPSFTAVLS
jgi:hypothetical protein